MKKLVRLLAAAGLALGAATAFAQKPLEVIVFAGGGNWPIFVAQDKGLFTANNLAVKVTATPNSVFQITGLMDGKFDIGMSTFDNVVAYAEGQGETNLSTPSDIIAIMGGLSSALRFVVSPEIKTYADLRGKLLGVDAATTGYALAMYKMLAMNGLSMQDYQLDRVGGTAFRVQALMQGKVAGTMINSPLEILPESKGFRRLGDVLQTFGAYQAISGVARRSWAEKNEDRLIGYIKSYVAAVDWLYDPANRSEAAAIYQKNIPNSTRETAERAWEVMLFGKEGFQRRAKIDQDGVRAVVQIRSEFGTPKKQLGDSSRYVDERWYEKALR